MLAFRCAWTRSHSTGMDVDDTLSFCPADSLDPLPALMVEAKQGDLSVTVPILLDVNQVIALRNHLETWISLVGGCPTEDPERPAVEGYI